MIMNVQRITRQNGLILGVLVLLLLSIAVVPAAAKEITISPGTSINKTIASADPGDTLILNPGTYNENGIVVGKPLIISADTKHGHGPSDTVIDGKSTAPRIFTVTGDYSLTIDNLTIRNGRADDSVTPNTRGGNGGAIESRGPVIITSSKITGCSAGNSGQFAQGGSGGAISTSRSVTLASSSISGSRAGKGGTADDMNPRTAGSGGNGGAIEAGESISLSSSSIIGCLAGSGGDYYQKNAGDGGHGGALYAKGEIVTTLSSFSDCSAGYNGGDGGAIWSASSVTITSTTFTGCQAGDGGNGLRHNDGGDGGAIWSGSQVTIISSTFTDCRGGTANSEYTSGGSGGAVSSKDQVTVTSSAFTHCKAGDHSQGGGVWTYGGSGGAISTSGAVTLIGSTITGCSAGNVGYSEYGGNGGGISSGGLVTVTTSTITNCSAGTGDSSCSYGGNGGAIYSSGPVKVTSSTITNCRAGNGGITRSSSGNIFGRIGNGGAIYGSSGSIHFSRLADNEAIGRAIHGSIDATDNWWGTNSNPARFVDGGATVNPWLVLDVTANPAMLIVGQTSTVRANLTFNSDGKDTSRSGYVPDGIPVLFTTNSYPTDIYPIITAFRNGTAVTVFHPKSPGTVTVSAVIDNVKAGTEVTAT